MKHEINAKDFEGFTRRIDIASAFGMGESKELYVTLKINMFGNIITDGFIIEDHKTIVCMTTDFSVAIEKYNEL